MRGREVGMVVAGVCDGGCEGKRVDRIGAIDGKYYAGE